MDNNNLLNKNDIKDLINDSLLENDLISQEIYLKCGKPKVVQSLPGDLRTTDLDKLNHRKEAIKIRIEELNLQISQKTLDVKVNNNEMKKLRLEIKDDKSKRKEFDEEYKDQTKRLKEVYKKQILPAVKKYQKTLEKGSYIWKQMEYIKEIASFLNINKKNFESEYHHKYLDSSFYTSTRNFTQMVHEIGVDLAYGKNTDDMARHIGNLVADTGGDWTIGAHNDKTNFNNWSYAGASYDIYNRQIPRKQAEIDTLKSSNDDIKKEIGDLKKQRKQLRDEGKLTDNRISNTHDLAVPGDTYWDRENNTLYRVHDDGSIGSAPYYGPGASDHLYD